jgi:hypothetical protein
MAKRSLTFSSLFPTAEMMRSLFAPATGASVVKKLLSKINTRQFGTTAAKSVGKDVKRQPDNSSKVRLRKCSFGKASGIGLSVTGRGNQSNLTQLAHVTRYAYS